MTVEGNSITGARADAVEVITTDHRAVERLFVLLQAATKPADTELRRDLGQRIVRELSAHAAAEEQVLYPAVRRYVDGGDDLADEAIAEHQELKELLTTLDGADPDDDAFLTGFRRAEELVAAHVRDEEGRLLPQLRDCAGGERLYELGDALGTAKAAAPTHPHPHAPNTPPGNVVAGAVAGAVDKVRDAAKKVTDR
jgi:hemerythrin superfamily protein